MTITINPTASQNPFTDSNLTQTNSGTCASDGSSLVTQQNSSTLNRLLANAAFSATQSVQATIGFASNYADNWANYCHSLLLLYTDPNNWVGLTYYHAGSDNNNVDLLVSIGGVQNTYNFVAAVADNYFDAGNVIKLAVTWSGADATFTLTKNGSGVGSPVTRTSFALTSGVPGFAAERNAFGRSVGFSQLVLTGESGDSTAPVLTVPVANATAATTATVGATTDEANGTLYSVITTSSTQPSVAQIKAGQNHLGASATWSSNQAISSTGAKTFSVTGLTAGTMYYTYTVHADAAGNNSNVVASGFAAYDVSAASVTPATQSVALNATGSFVYTLNVTPVSVTPVANVVALTLATPISTAAVTPVTQNIVLAVTLPVTRVQALPLTQSVALNFSGVVAYTLNVTPASPTIAMQDVALNPSYPSAGGAGATTGRRNRRYSYALKYFSRG